MSLMPSWRGLFHKYCVLKWIRPEMTSPIAPSWIRLTVSMIRGVWRRLGPGMAPGFFLLALLADFDNLPNPHGIDGARLLEEDVLPRLDRRRKMDRAEA